MAVNNRLLRASLGEVEACGMSSLGCLRVLIRNGFVELGEVVRLGQGEEQLYRVTERGWQFVQAYDVGRHLLRRREWTVGAEMEWQRERLGLVSVS